MKTYMYAAILDLFLV